MSRAVRPLRLAGAAVLVPVAVYGAALSYDSLYREAHRVFAQPLFGLDLALGLPLVVDLLILGASLVYIDGARHGRPGAGWRLTAHAAVGTTLALNAMAAGSPSQIPWHIVAPAVWSVLVELTAREMLQEWRAATVAPTGRIPARLWLTAPGESLRTWLRMARRVEGEHAAARIDVATCAAAVLALDTATAGQGRAGRRARRIVVRLVTSGTVAPVEVLSVLGWGLPAGSRPVLTAQEITEAALTRALTAPAPDTVPAPAEAPVVDIQAAPAPIAAPAPAAPITAPVVAAPVAAVAPVAAAARRTGGPGRPGGLDAPTMAMAVSAHRMRQAGLTYPAIAAALSTDDRAVGARTVGDWCRRADVAAAATAATNSAQLTAPVAAAAPRAASVAREVDADAADAVVDITAAARTRAPLRVAALG